MSHVVMLGFFYLGDVRFGCICWILCCAVVVIVSTISSLPKCDGVMEFEYLVVYGF